MPVARHFLRPTRELWRATLAAPLFGLAPGGVYKASPVTRGTGALLPHLFTLTFFADLYRSAKKAVYFLLHFPSRHRDSTLWSTLPCGVRTFLRIKYPAIVCTAPAVYSVVILRYLSSPVPSRVSCHKMDKISDYRSVAGHYTSVAEYSCYIRNR
ncbi:hypothetical protein BuS5_00279 [Desulfosarcina sp. BuS5]|nr:hypothetical protein BuS5_00279 [Desulfosarcina sp. BuS5]